MGVCAGSWRVLAPPGPVLGRTSFPFRCARPLSPAPTDDIAGSALTVVCAVPASWMFKRNTKQMRNVAGPLIRRQEGDDNCPRGALFTAQPILYFRERE